jgi:hypothetical protein
VQRVKTWRATSDGSVDGSTGRDSCGRADDAAAAEDEEEGRVLGVYPYGDW